MTTTTKTMNSSLPHHIRHLSIDVNNPREFFMDSPVTSISSTCGSTSASSDLPTSISHANRSKCIKAQRRQSSISYNPSTPSSTPPTSRSNSISGSATATPRTSPQKQRPRPLSLSISNNTSPRHIPIYNTPMTISETYAPLLQFIAQKESKCLELRSQLSQQEKELAILKRKWEKIVSRHHNYPTSPPVKVDISALMTGVSTGFGEDLRGVGKMIKELASPASPSPQVSKARHGSVSSSSASSESRSSFDESIYSASSADTSIDIPIMPSKLPNITDTTTDAVSSPVASTEIGDKNHTVRRRPRERRPILEDFGATPTLAPNPARLPSSNTSTTASTASSCRNSPIRELAPLPSTALASFLPDLSSSAFNNAVDRILYPSVNINAAMDKILSPKQQRRASKVLEGVSGALWGAISASGNATTQHLNSTVERNEGYTVTSSPSSFLTSPAISRSSSIREEVMEEN